jgi:hypothetical protein
MTYRPLSGRFGLSTLQVGIRPKRGYLLWKGGGEDHWGFGLRVERLGLLGLEKIEGFIEADLLAGRSFLIFERAINYYLHQEGASVIVIVMRAEQVESAIGVPEVSERDDRTYSFLKEVNGKYAVMSFSDRTIKIGSNGMGISEQNLGWLTGFIEADGCFTVQRRKSKSHRLEWIFHELQGIKDQAIAGELEPHNRALLEQAVGTRNGLRGPYQGHLIKGHSEGSG